MTDKDNMSPGSALAAKRKVLVKICPICKTEFKGLKTAIYCSNKCKQKAKYARKKLTLLC